MKATVAKVLITELGIPSDGYISWPQRLEYLLQEYSANTLDYLICGESSNALKSSKTQRIICNPKSRLRNKFFKGKRFNAYEQAIASIASKHSHVILCIVDTTKLKDFLFKFIQESGLEKKVSIIFYQCGFSYYQTPEAHAHFSKGIAELILLSNHSYRYEFDKYPDMPYVVHVLHNPINHTIFKALPAAEKALLRKEKNFGDTIHFMWVSHDKPVKGLQVILEAWKLFYHAEKNVQLHVVGVKREQQLPGVIFHGKIPNKELPAWYQASDVFIFSPLRNEGYGLAVAEAISCGCLGISSYGGGAVDFFKEGEHGIGIREPNFLHTWATAFDKALADLPAFQEAHKDDYLKPPPFTTYDEWCASFLKIFDNLEQRLS